jgi:4-oxalocrotonate tautomerase
MPMITILYSTPRPASGLKSQIAAAAADLAASILRKDPKVTAVIVDAVDPDDWFAGGASLAAQRLASFWLDIRIVDGSNTKDEKADYISAVFQRMGELLGPLHSESYVHVNDVRADGYGFGGLTQERRYIARKLAVTLHSEAA